MTWLWVILIVAGIGAIIGYLRKGRDGAIEGGVGAGIGCGYVILQIFLWIVAIVLLFRIGSCLFN